MKALFCCQVRKEVSSRFDLSQMQQRKRLRDGKPAPRAECQAGRGWNELSCAAWNLEEARRDSSEGFEKKNSCIMITSVLFTHFDIIFVSSVCSCLPSHELGSVENIQAFAHKGTQMYHLNVKEVLNSARI